MRTGLFDAHHGGQSEAAQQVRSDRFSSRFAVPPRHDAFVEGDLTEALQRPLGGVHELLDAVEAEPFHCAKLSAQIGFGHARPRQKHHAKGHGSKFADVALERAGVSLLPFFEQKRVRVRHCTGMVAQKLNGSPILMRLG
jgi:hypothetical protein